MTQTDTTQPTLTDLATSVAGLEASMTAILSTIDRLDAEQALQTHALGEIVSGRFQGDLPNAAADVAALAGGTLPDGVTPVPF